MKRSVILFVAGVLLLSACGGSDDTSASTTVSTLATTTTATAVTTTVAATTTAAETTTTAGAEVPTVPVVPGESADADAIVDLFAVVFDGTTAYEEKAPFIDDPAGLESTVDAYMTAGDAVGGIFLEVAGVGVDGDHAVVGYDLLFGGNAFMTDQVGDAVLNGGQWQVTREYFCSIMVLARVGCP